MSQLKSNKYYIFCVWVTAHMSYCIVICDLSGSIYFSTLSHKRHDFFFPKMLLNIQNMCFDFLYNICPKKILILR